MGGKSKSSNLAIVQQQQQEAADTRAKEAARQARLTQGVNAINSAFSGFGDDYYNKYRQGVLDYYTPQVGDQYTKAKDKLTYDLARAGTLDSTMAATQQADLDKQNKLNMADIYNKADTGAANVRSRVATEKANATNQLYATEDPDVAANQATAAVRNISLDQPQLTALGDIFKTALVGGANAMTGYKNQSLYNQYPVAAAPTPTTAPGTRIA
jgi:hypothetical protein